MKPLKQTAKKYMALLLVLLQMLSILPSGVFATSETEYTNNGPDGFTVSIMWSTLRSDYGWDATRDEMRQPKLFVTYRVENANRTYAPGELKFTIPGIGNALRGGIAKASDIAADEVGGASNPQNRWEYTWDSVNDVYTFTNKYEIPQYQSMSGGFEMLWTFYARNNTTDYTDTVEAQFGIITDGVEESVNMPPLTYHFTSVRDDYRIGMSSDDLSADEWESESTDYAWYDVNTRIEADYNARGLYRSRYFISFPDLSEKINPDNGDLIVKDENGNEYKLEYNEETETWGFYMWEEKGGDLASKNSSRSYKFRLGVRKSCVKEELESQEGFELKVHGHLDRLYNDETTWTTVETDYTYDYDKDNAEWPRNDVDDEIVIRMRDYSYESDGYIYATDKDGEYSYSNEGNSAPYSYTDRLRSNHLYDGTVVRFWLEGTAKRNYVQSSASVGTNAADGPSVLDEGIDPIGDDTPWDMILNDDKLSIQLRDGTSRDLTDSEYDFVSITVPYDKYGYDYDIYVAYAQDTRTDDYKLLYTGNTSSALTWPLTGVKAFYVRIKDIVGSYYTRIETGVSMHLDWEATQALPEDKQPDHEQFFTNYGHMNVLYRPDENGEYAEVWRAYVQARAYVRIDVTMIDTYIDLYEFKTSSEEDYYKTGVTATGTLTADNSGELKKFSLYVVLPKGVHADFNSKDVPYSLTLNGVSYDDGSMVTFTNGEYVNVSTTTLGDCEMIVFDFDFTDYPLEIKENTQITANFGAYLRYSDFVELGSRYTAYSYVAIHDEGVEKLIGSRLVSDVDDVDGDGNLTEQHARHSDTEQVLDSAQQWSERPFKYVKSEFTDGYVVDAFVERYQGPGEQPGALYSYRLDYSCTDAITELVFYDYMEQGAVINEEGGWKETESEWQGSYISIDVSQLEQLGGEVTVYYSEDLTEGVGVRAENRTITWTKPGSDESKWKKLTNDTDIFDAKTIAVYVDTSGMDMGVLAPGQLVYITVNMIAPSSKDYLDMTAVNQFTVGYTGYRGGSLDGALIERTTLPSNAVTVTLQESVGRLVLQKVDAENVTAYDEDGNPIRHAQVTGGKYRVYDENMKIVFEGSPDALGRVIVENLEYGIYYWEEIEAPGGYEKAEGLHEVLLNYGTNNIAIEMENTRLPGEVILTKLDAQFAGYGGIPGAVFELYTRTGLPVFAEDTGDGSYRYVAEFDSENPNIVNRFTTDENGQIHITDMPWGSYYFKEIEAPFGYEMVDENIPFTISRSAFVQGENGSEGRVIAYVTATNDELPASIRLIKTDETNGAFIADAMFDLYRVARGDETQDVLVASNLQTNMVGEIEVGDLLFGEYYFKETRNGAGYVLPQGENAETEHVTLDTTTVSQTVKLSFTNERLKGSVQMLKEDDFLQIVVGAEYELYYKPDTEILKGDAHDDEHTGYTLLETYTTNSSGVILVSDLEWGEYCFIEKSAPQGYAVSDEHILFTVDKNTVQNRIYIEVTDERAKGTVHLIKVDKNDKATALPGAEFALYASDGTPMVAGEDYTTDKDDNKIITGDEGDVTIFGLKQGSYYLVETKAPEGYSLSGDYIRFAIQRGNSGEGKVLEVRAEDEKGKAVIVVNKEIVGEIHDDFGNPTFIFTVTGVNSGRVYTKSITLSELKTKGSVAFTVDANDSYIIKELDSPRYKLVDIGTVGENNIVEVDTDEKTATTDVLDGTDKAHAEVTYKNTLTQYDKLSHTASATNLLKASRRLVSITVDYYGPNPINDANMKEGNGYIDGYDPNTENFTFRSGDMTVTAYYDDGSTEVLTWGSFTLDPEFVNGANGDVAQMIDVYYTENGITCTDSFTVDVDLYYTPRYSVILDCGTGGAIIVDGEWGDGLSAIEKVVRQQIKAGTTVTLPSSEPQHPEKVFLGWTDENGGKTVKYKPGASIKVDNDIILYAVYANYTVKYAVRIYGILQDEDENGNKLGLTFGPAGGRSYISSYRSHDTSDGSICIHDLSWDEIIARSKTNPWVFEECMRNACTHDVEINIKGKLAGTSYVSKMDNGDGASAIYTSLAVNYRRWNYGNTVSGGWRDSMMRNTLNGVHTANSGQTWADGVTVDELNGTDCLLAMLPKELRDNIVAKKVISATGYSRTSELATTYDKLWLFSVKEMYNGGSNMSSTTYVDNREGELYMSQTAEYLDAYAGNTAVNVFYLETGANVASDQAPFSRTLYGSSYVYVVYFRGSSYSHPSATAGHSGNFMSPRSFVFGFCLPGPETGTNTP